MQDSFLCAWKFTQEIFQVIGDRDTLTVIVIIIVAVGVGIFLSSCVATHGICFFP